MMDALIKGTREIPGAVEQKLTMLDPNVTARRMMAASQIGAQAFQAQTAIRQQEVQEQRIEDQMRMDMAKTFAADVGSIMDSIQKMNDVFDAEAAAQTLSDKKLVAGMDADTRAILEEKIEMEMLPSRVEARTELVEDIFRDKDTGGLDVEDVMSDDWIDNFAFDV